MADDKWQFKRRVAPTEFSEYKSYIRKTEKKNGNHLLRMPPDGSKRTKNKRFFSYMRCVFKSSLITSFPQIASAKSERLRIWKSLVFLFCLTGFLYQTIRFLKFYYTYPVTVNLEEANPFEIVQPALTFCSNNIIRRQTYCEKNDSQCVEYDEESFCERYPKYCENNRTLYTKVPSQYDAERNHQTIFSWSQVIEYGTSENMIEDCYKINEDQMLNCSIRPIPFITNDGKPTICYTVDSLTDLPNTKDDIYVNTFRIITELETFPEEYFYHSDPVLIRVSVHDRRNVLNPYVVGQSLKGGYSYTAYVSMTEDILLPYPFDTNCTDYFSLWKQNNGTGPLNEAMCKEYCKLKKILAMNECVDQNIYYPHFENLCQDSETTTHEIIKECALNCQPACHERKYEVKYDESLYLSHLPLVFNGDEDGGNLSLNCDGKGMTNCKLSEISLTVSFREYHLTRRVTQPKYNSMELFSNIGGFMGMWLGLSLVSMFDFLESILRLLHYPIRKKIT